LTDDASKSTIWKLVGQDFPVNPGLGLTRQSISSMSLSMSVEVFKL
jgi:hypothetical protein